MIEDKIYKSFQVRGQSYHIFINILYHLYIIDQKDFKEIHTSSLKMNIYRSFNRFEDLLLLLRLI